MDESTIKPMTFAKGRKKKILVSTPVGLRWVSYPELAEVEENNEDHTRDQEEQPVYGRS